MEGCQEGGTATAGPDPVGFCLKLIGSVVGALAGSNACGGGGGGSSYDQPACNDDDYDQCKKDQEYLERQRQGIITILSNASLSYLDRIEVYNRRAVNFNIIVKNHNADCPESQVSPLPILTTLDGANM